MDGAIDPTSPERTSTHFLVFHNDEVHSYPYVMQIALRELHAKKFEAYKFARLIDQSGSAAIGFYDLELMELVRARVSAYGPDRLIRNSSGPLILSVVPAEAIGEIAVFGHLTSKAQLPSADASRRIDDNERELNLLVTGIEDPDEGNYRVHHFAIGCLLAFILMRLLA